MDNELKQMEYPGRGIVLGLTPNNELFCSYFITGRSRSSQARKLVPERRMISTMPTDKNELAKGNVDLLIYNAIAWHDSSTTSSSSISHGDLIVAVSNGKQTDSIITGMLCNDNSLLRSTEQWNYEPDEPNYTPRINGRIIVPSGDYSQFAIELSIIKRGTDGQADRKTYCYSQLLNDGGTARCMTTYTGQNAQPLPSFEGEPFVIPIKSTTARTLCEEISEMLKKDYRVSVASVLIPESRDISHYVKNFRE